MDRHYVEKKEKQLIPTELGKVVNNLLVESFPDIINVEFTANIENQFDDVADGKQEWKQILRDFYGPFEAEVKKIDKELEHVQVKEEESNVICEKCGRTMVVKYGRYGKFLACPGYPECKNIKPYEVKIDVPCPVCGGDVYVRKSKRGKNFYICANNKNTPDSCQFISWNKPKPGEPWTQEQEKKRRTKSAARTRKSTSKKK